ncbi:tRNA (N6-isopentenyl adenosine(37)-C2)-methylthiotransferase MiaB [Candidatus Desantisbacteria bacterium]|nr:tRNA (N6-isopentenyl adenosine(37)-C2)-methylthiotransferase MiaB [Candidatus Desantisbacteria bacterium]
MKFDKLKFSIKTYGCQMNELDTEIMAGTLKNMGFSEALGYDDADIVVLNTCAVRHRAEEKIFGHIGALKRYKEKKSGMILVIAGCLAQQKKDEIFKLFPHIDIIIGTLTKKELQPLIEKILHKRKSQIRIISEQKEVYEPDYIERESKIKASVSIMEGCNNFCSYCIVPYVRGREISRRKENIIKEINNLAENGYNEILLLGQNVNSYIDNSYDFADLIESINDIAGIERIRFMTSHPKDISNKLIEKISTSKKACEHFHFPLQSGSDKILDKMNRKYTLNEYINKVEYIRKLIPGVSITTDIIVGFPDEDENDFQDTVKAVENIKFDGVFIFYYSPRQGTHAASFDDNVTYAEKIRRLEYLLRTQEKIMVNINTGLIDQKFEVLVEGRSKKDEEQLTGRTRTNKIVIFSKKENMQNKDLAGQFINIKITNIGAYTLLGEISE